MPKSFESGGTIGFRIIGAFKLASAVLLVALGFGIFRMIGGDVGAHLAHLLSRLRLDPDNHFLHEAISKVAGIDRKHLRQIGFGTFVYAGLHLAEGVGLLLRKQWAGYLTVVITGSLLPLEGYEVLHKAHWIKILVLVVNLAIVVYLVVKLRAEHRAQRPTGAVSGG